MVVLVVVIRFFEGMMLVSMVDLLMFICLIRVILVLSWVVVRVVL